MIIADEWLIGAITAVAGFFGYMAKSVLFDMRAVIDRNTQAVSALVAIVQRCDKK